MSKKVEVEKVTIGDIRKMEPEEFSEYRDELMKLLMAIPEDTLRQSMAMFKDFMASGH